MSENIVLVSWDSVREDHFPSYGYERNTTPMVQEIGQDRNMTIFENTHVAGVGTPASFTGVFTGEHTSSNMLDVSPGHWRRQNEERRLLSEILKANGYHTGAFHYNALMSSEFGWNRGWDTYSDGFWDKEQGESSQKEDDGGLKKRIYAFLQERGLANFAVHTKKMITGEPTEAWTQMWPDISDFVESAPEPWFLWVLLIDTHHPYLPPKPERKWTQYGNRGTYVSSFLMRRYRNLVGERRQKIVNAYDNTIRYADRFFGKLVSHLEDEGHEDIPIILHSDHGDEFGEHANYGHRPLMYNTVTRVPLITYNIETGADRIAGPNSLLDLGETILDVADINEDLNEGRTILDDRDEVYIENRLGDYGTAAAIVEEDLKTLYHPAGDWGHGGHIDSGLEAYLVSDWMERNDVFDSRTTRGGELMERVTETKNQNVSSKTGTDVSDEVHERLSELGYIE